MKLSSATTVSILISATLLIPSQGFSWGADGHEITAIIALKYLDAQGNRTAASHVRDVTQKLTNVFYVGKKQGELIPCSGNSASCLDMRGIAGASIFPDQVKNDFDNRDTADWHFINTDAQSYSQKESLTPLTAGADLTGDIYIMINGFQHYLKTLNSSGTGELDQNMLKVPSAVTWSKSCQTRPYGCEAEALAFLIHFVGDIHQPLHVSSKCDRGGNSQIITVFGRELSPWKDPRTHAPQKYELHAMWDGDLFTTSPGADGQPNLVTKISDHVLRADRLIADSQSNLAKWQSDKDVAHWANESISFNKNAYDFTLDPQTSAKLKGVHETARKVAAAGVASSDGPASWVPMRCPSPMVVRDVGLKYQSASVPIMLQRIAQGGARLAAMLADIYPN